MPPTAGEGVPVLGASMETVERYHAEGNARWARHELDHRTLESRIAVLEATDGRTDLRLQQGAQSFNKIEQQIEKLSVVIDGVSKSVAARTTMPTWRIFLYVGGIVGVIGVLIFQMAKYPDRADMDALRVEIGAIHKQQEDQRVQSALDARANADLKVAVDGLSTKVDLLVHRP